MIVGAAGVIPKTTVPKTTVAWFRDPQLIESLGLNQNQMYYVETGVNFVADYSVFFDIEI